MIHIVLGIKEARDVGGEADGEDGEDVGGGLPGLPGQLQRVANSQEPLGRNGERHEDTSGQTDVTKTQLNFDSFKLSGYFITGVT